MSIAKDLSDLWVISKLGRFLYDGVSRFQDRLQAQADASKRPTIAWNITQHVHQPSLPQFRRMKLLWILHSFWISVPTGLFLASFSMQSTTVQRFPTSVSPLVIGCALESGKWWYFCLSCASASLFYPSHRQPYVNLLRISPKRRKNKS